MFKKLCSADAVVVAMVGFGLSLGTLSASADTILFTDNSPASTDKVGHFNGSLSFSPNGFVGGADIQISLTNLATTAAGGKITGFLFNIPDIPDDSLTAVLTSAPNPSWADLLPGESAAPFGTYEEGAALGGGWLGGGSPNDGIVRGATGTFLFEVGGSGENTPLLTASSFLDLNNQPNQLVVRFKGFDQNGLSDKVPAKLTVVPLPPAVLGGMVLLGGLGAVKLWGRRAATAE
jgi:hypothetical protein